MSDVKIPEPESTLAMFFNPSLKNQKFLAFTEKGIFYLLNDSGEVVKQIDHVNILASISQEAPVQLKEKFGFSPEVKTIVIKNSIPIVNYLKKYSFPYEETAEGLNILFWVFALLCCQRKIDIRVLQII
jgi:hypothetical protein